jgi:hypothetical protein
LVKTVISANQIDLAHAVPPLLGLYPIVDGIVYEDLTVHSTPTDLTGAKNATAVINNNRISHAGVFLPLRGINLRGRAHDVVVAGNDMTNLKVCHAQVFLGTQVYNCVCTANSFGRLNSQSATNGDKLQPVALLLCEGKGNLLLDHDFTATDVSGWIGLYPVDGPGCIKLSSVSTSNLVILDVANFRPVNVQADQWWDGNPTQCSDDNPMTDNNPTGNRVVTLSKYQTVFPFHPGSWLWEKFEERHWSLTHTIPPLPHEPPILRRALTRALIATAGRR